MGIYRIITNGKVYRVERLKEYYLDPATHDCGPAQITTYYRWNKLEDYQTIEDAENKIDELREADIVPPPEKWKQLGDIKLTGDVEAEDHYRHEAAMASENDGVEVEEGRA